jgi:aryl carrier-like protein
LNGLFLLFTLHNNLFENHKFKNLKNEILLISKSLDDLICIFFFKKLKKKKGKIFFKKLKKKVIIFFKFKIIKKNKSIF